MLSKEDLHTLKSQNYQLIFNIGVPYSGKKTQCEKISKEFKYSKISIKEIIKKEISLKTKLGLEAKKSIDNAQPIKTETLTGILIKEIDELNLNNNELNLQNEFLKNKVIYYEKEIKYLNTKNKVPIDPDSEEEVFEKLKDGIVLAKLENLADKNLLNEDDLKTVIGDIGRYKGDIKET